MPCKIAIRLILEDSSRTAVKTDQGLYINANEMLHPKPEARRIIRVQYCTVFCQIMEKSVWLGLGGCKLWKRAGIEI